MCPMTTVGSGTEFYGKQCFLSTSNIASLPPKKQTKGNTIKKKTTSKSNKQSKQLPQSQKLKKKLFSLSVPDSTLYHRRVAAISKKSRGQDLPRV